MSKERLEEAKLMAEMLKVETRLPHDFPFDLVDWLVEQAELVGYFARKNGELNEFLNKYIESKHLGKNVIDVAMDIIVKQSERVQEVEEERDEWKDTAQSYYMTNQELREQNKRYREALEFYANKINYLTFIENGKSNIEHDQGEKARKALEG